ncbi:ABC transporter ATP-binding protein [Pelomonas sp. SE-A7]|uniref:ABC transporter ATP-binding protein n=1 Tax=Pelomonas sp. SE-A7 TaxID=3054953 RepID=UPI00259D03AB|nr:ABC transporter ATP-binding protein [Pelomonas sp. SE-A7]MDM4767749.1 ABC transporter ATP-binding protein [Pelomonas sp. SE-A7]
MSPNTAAPALEINELQKSFGGKPAVDRLNLSIPRGEFHALLGPNGAGKTTTLRMVAGLLLPDGGTARVLGHDITQQPNEAKRLMAFLPDDPLLYGKLRPLEYLEFVAGLWGVDPVVGAPRAEELLRWLDLWKHTGELAEGFSRGMRQKLALAGALIHDPQLLILDEPLTGLDAGAARQVKDLLVDRVAKGYTVVLTTHILEIAERLAQRISIIQGGRIIAQGSLDELRAGASGGATLEDVFLQLTAADA